MENEKRELNEEEKKYTKDLTKEDFTIMKELIDYFRVRIPKFDEKRLIRIFNFLIFTLKTRNYLKDKTRKIKENSWTHCPKCYKKKNGRYRGFCPDCDEEWKHFTKMKETEKNNILEIRGILSTLSDDYGQGIAKPKRLKELNKFLKEFSERKWK